jgi:hypothetical protein
VRTGEMEKANAHESRVTTKLLEDKLIKISLEPLSNIRKILTSSTKVAILPPNWYYAHVVPK